MVTSSRSSQRRTSRALLAVAATTLALVCGSIMTLASLASCKTETPSSVVVENAFPVSPDPPHATVVYRVWWNASYFPDPLLPGESSTQERAVQATDSAYALVAPGWDPTSGAPPTVLVALKSKAVLSVKRGDTLVISMSNDTFTGSCDTEPLSQEDADLITKKIFPDDFKGVHYDARTCLLIPNPAVEDAGVEEPPPDAGTDADADAATPTDADAD